MFATALSVPANMIDIRIEPASASQVRTRVVFPVSSHSSRWKARSTSTMWLIDPLAASRASSAVCSCGDQRGPVGSGADDGGGQPFQGGADLEHVQDLRVGQGPDGQPAPLAGLDQALLLQLAQRLPQGSARDAQGGGQFRFDQPGAGGDLAGGDRVAQLVQGLLAQAGLGQPAQARARVQTAQRHSVPFGCPRS